MDTQIICALITLLGVCLSAFLSYWVSRSTAKSEAEKLKLSWAHEDSVTSDEEFAQLAAAVSSFIYRTNNGFRTNADDALQKVAAARARETGELGDILDQLYINLREGSPSKIDISLSSAIECKRRK